MKKMFRYCINEGEAGGIVLAPDIKGFAKRKVKEYYESIAPGKYDFDTKDEIVVLDLEDDDYYDSTNHDVYSFY